MCSKENRFIRDGGQKEPSEIWYLEEIVIKRGNKIKVEVTIEKVFVSMFQIWDLTLGLFCCDIVLLFLLIFCLLVQMYIMYKV